MTHEQLVNLLRDRFTDSFYSPREEGRNEMANFLASATGLTFEQAQESLATLELEGIIHFMEHDEPSAPAMLEATRYGDMPAHGTVPGYWHIGPQP